ncbi:DUF7344 domain-containing protein [Halorussus litoreus]|uniref:DUF7344 domain-containing protein n=1 Tax=Halorussus litoreus TaxID=1710536 RepID=UPI000E2726AE|nr:hypothetical protein [Halorussus litoreus]
MPEIQSEVDVATACSLLENESRRAILRTLANGSGTATRREIARTLAQDERRTSERIEAALYHVHLPKLATEGAIRYDLDSQSVTLTDEGERFFQFLDSIERRMDGQR